MKKLIPLLLISLLLFTFGCSDKKEAKKPTTKKPAVSNDKKAATSTPTSVPSTTPTSVPATAPVAKSSTPAKSTTPPVSQTAPNNAANERAAKAAQLNAYMDQENAIGQQMSNDLSQLDNQMNNSSDINALTAYLNQSITQITTCRNNIAALSAPQVLQSYRQYELQLLDQFNTTFVKMRDAVSSGDEGLLNQAITDFDSVVNNSDSTLTSLLTEAAKQSGLDLVVQGDGNYIFK